MPVGRIAVMAAIVATLLYVPLGTVLALLCFAALDVSVFSFVTFGDTVNAFAGLLLWWAASFVPAFAYSALVSR
jgi:hypothetical protein